ncbi:hypothetical protein QN224_22290 [Sinorhizobium sp. 8-89]|uniref:hypothetical protein n=1 Tax=Sinorhizobium sp. 7-81 TaxID=3049087 RepID=UPI0024C24153|nr:hypothetical protein [Sinorhizobium sp. 7-81]MDK1388143.1 hypothetical protein [Sinorhizobium sp. 7-81]
MQRFPLAPLYRMRRQGAIRGSNAADFLLSGLNPNQTRFNAIESSNTRSGFIDRVPKGACARVAAKREIVVPWSHFDLEVEYYFQVS